MKKGFLLAFFCAAILPLAWGNAANEPTITQDELVRRTQELFDSVAPGNAEPFKKYFAEDAMFFDEKGRGMDKAALVKDVQPLPKGYSGTIKLVRPKSHIEGDVAILSYDLDETETIFGQQMTARYHETDTWMRRRRQMADRSGAGAALLRRSCSRQGRHQQVLIVRRDVQAGAGTDDDHHSGRRPSLRDAQRASEGRTDP